MDPERWERLKTLFTSALEKNAAQRDAFLADACREDPALLAELRALFDHHDEDGFLETPAFAPSPGPDGNAPAPLREGAALGPYEIVRRIGSGGMGVVYLGRDRGLDRPVAIKMLADAFAGDRRRLERLRREARAAAMLPHPGIATVYSLEECDGRLYMVSEYVQGKTLRQVVESGPLPFPALLDVALQAARALAAAHDRGIVHRDLKPENIMLTDAGAVKILDFGLARRALPAPGEGDLTRSGTFLGTPAYASPEQLLGRPAGPAADIFSLGTLLCELATGRHPFGGHPSLSTIARILAGQPEEDFSLHPDLPAAFVSVLRRCLARNPEERYSDARALLADLEPLAARPLPAFAATAPRADGARWWWQFHQAAAGFGYYAMLYPLWRVKEWLGGVEGSLLFFPALVAVGVAANLRLHLWFTSRFYVSELPEQRRRVAPWVRAADWLFSAMLALTALRVHQEHAIIATLLMGASIGSLVAFLMVEPATARAALREG